MAGRVPKKCQLKAGAKLLAYKTRPGAHLCRLSIGLRGVTGVELAAVHLYKIIMMWAGISGLCKWRELDPNKVASSVEVIADVVIALQWYPCVRRRRYI